MRTNIGKGISFVFLGEWADPIYEYEGKEYNYWDVWELIEKHDANTEDILDAILTIKSLESSEV